MQIFDDKDDAVVGKSKKPYLEDPWQIFDDKDDAVAEDAEPDGQDLGDNGGPLIRQLYSTAGLNKIPELEAQLVNYLLYE